MEDFAYRIYLIVSRGLEFFFHHFVLLLIKGGLYVYFFTLSKV